MAAANPFALVLGTRKPECATIKVAEQGTMGLVTLDDTEDASYLAHASKALSRGCLLLNVRYGSSDGHKQPVRLR